MGGSSGASSIARITFITFFLTIRYLYRRIIKIKIKLIGINQKILRSCGRVQYLNGSPVYPEIQVHDGKWFITWQSAFCPQTPGHGSWHLFLTQALFEGQSELRTHSGRQPS